MRYAYGTLGGFLAGQATSNFSAPDANGETLDFGGNVGVPRRKSHAVCIEGQLFDFGVLPDLRAALAGAGSFFAPPEEDIASGALAGAGPTRCTVTCTIWTVVTGLSLLSRLTRAIAFTTSGLSHCPQIV